MRRYLLGNSLIFAAMAVSVFLLIAVVLGFDGLYGQDSYEYLRYTKQLRNFALTGAGPGTFFWPLGYPMISSALSIIITNDALALQLVSLLAFVGLMIYILRFIHLLNAASAFHAPVYVLVFAFFSPFLLRSAFLSMPDVGAAFLVTAAGFHFLAYAKNHTSHANFVLGMAFSAMSVMFRYPVILLVIPLAGYALAVMMKSRQWRALAVGILPAVIIVLPHPLLYGGESLDFLHHSHLGSLAVMNLFSSSFDTIDGVKYYRFPNIIYSLTALLHPGFFAAGVFLVPFIRISFFSAPQRMMLIGSIAYLLFLAAIPFQNYRFIIPAIPLLLVLFYPAFEAAISRVKKTGFRTALFIMVISSQITLFYFAFKPFYSRNALERELSIYLNEQNISTLYTFDIDIALQQRKPDFEIKSLYGVRYEQYEQGAFALFNEQYFAQQWQNKPPMQNWNFLKDNYELVELKKFSKGWVLYAIR